MLIIPSSSTDLLSCFRDQCFVFCSLPVNFKYSCAFEMDLRKNYYGDVTGRWFLVVLVFDTS